MSSSLQKKNLKKIFFFFSPSSLFPPLPFRFLLCFIDETFFPPFPPFYLSFPFFFRCPPCYLRLYPILSKGFVFKQ